MLNISAAIVASNGKSSLFKGTKYLYPLLGKPLISRVVDVSLSIAKEVFVVAPCEDEARILRESIPLLPGESLCVIGDAVGEGSELTMVETAFLKSSCSRTILLPGDAPFLSLELLSTMVDLCRGRDAVVLRTPVGEMMPFPGVYATREATRAARATREEKASDVRRIIENLDHVMFLSSEVLGEFDSDLLTLFTVNSPMDLTKAEIILSGTLSKRHKRKHARSSRA